MDSSKGLPWLSIPPRAAEAWRGAWQLLALWLVWRLLSSLFAAFVSSLIPLTQPEQEIPFLPPSAPLTAWFERAWLSPWLRWDAAWYVRIITQGYQSTDGTTNFHPLYPWIAAPLTLLKINPLLSLLAVSSLSTLLLMVAFEHLARLDLDPANTRLALLLLLLFPTSFIFFAPYSESLFLLFAVLCLLWARQRHWWLAGLAGGLATLTRQQGIFLFIPLLWELWSTSRGDYPAVVQPKHLASHKFSRSWPALGLVPAGMVLWMAYRAVALNDLKIDLTNFQSLIYSFVISSQANQVVTIQAFLWPWESLWLALSKLVNAPDADIILNLAVSLLFLFYLILAWPHLRASYRAYSIAITLISFSYHTGPIHPYMGLPRHLLLAVPVFIGAAPLFNRPWKRLLIIASSTAGWFFMLTLFMLEAWVP